MGALHDRGGRRHQYKICAETRTQEGSQKSRVVRIRVSKTKCEKRGIEGAPLGRHICAERSRWAGVMPLGTMPRASRCSFFGPRLTRTGTIGDGVNSDRRSRKATSSRAIKFLARFSRGCYAAERCNTFGRPGGIMSEAPYS